MHSIVHLVRQRAVQQKLRPPVSRCDLDEAERLLGFPLPDLLRELYTEVGDGGFGPSHGFLPLLKSAPEVKLANGSLPRIESAVELYQLFKEGDPENPSWSWPDGLLPILDWGCAIRSCADCLTPSLPVIRDEPDVGRVKESPSLEQWLRSWIDGQDLWKLERH
jgi:SMI1 / KNR4 family (SUKH-1)